MNREKITVFGAGISGLVAAINLARLGFQVQVREKRNQIGGSPRWHPSVHQQTFDIEKTSNYIGIDVTPCFRPVRRHIFYFYGRKSVLDMPKNSYVCEKGQRSTSIESFLYAEARKYGIDFAFGETVDSWTLELNKAEGSKCIVATGLEVEPYKLLSIKHKTIRGVRGSQTVDKEGTAISYFGEYTNHDFGYVASFGRLHFSLLFAREGVGETNLEDFRRHLLESENLTFDDWQFSVGCVPMEKNLFKKGVVLAGTISGMIDPFYLNGISGALISGKIAALFFTDRKRSFQEFDRFTRNFHLKRTLKPISDKLPIKKFSFPLIAQLNNRLKWVGVI